MLSPVFWLSLVAVFWGMKWVADGLMSLARVSVERRATADVRASWVEPARPRPDVARQGAFADLDQAA